MGGTLRVRDSILRNWCACATPKRWNAVSTVGRRPWWDFRTAQAARCDLVVVPTQFFFLSALEATDSYFYEIWRRGRNPASRHCGVCKHALAGLTHAYMHTGDSVRMSNFDANTRSPATIGDANITQRSGGSPPARRIRSIRRMWVAGTNLKTNA